MMIKMLINKIININFYYWDNNKALSIIIYRMLLIITYLSKKININL